MKGVFNNFRNLSAFFAAGAVATAGMVAFPVSAVAFDITSPGSDGSTCYFSNGQVGGHIGRNSAYEAAVGVSSGDTRTTLVNSNDDKQKLWFGSQNYPNTYVNFNGKTTQIGYKVPAEHTLTSIDSGRGCLQAFSQDGYNFRYFVRAMPNSRVISRIMEVENVSQDNPTAWHYSSGGDTWFAGDDRGTAGLIGSFPYIKQSEKSGIMMNVPILPEGAKFNYLAGHYQTVNYKVRDVATDENFFNGDYQDQGIGIKIHGQPIPKGQTVTFGGSMSVGEASGLQILASDAQKIVSGDRATHTFTLINLSKDPVTEHLATDATNGWTTNIVGSSDVTIPGYGQLVVKVDHIMPNTANLTQANSSSRISFRASGTFTSFASSTSEIVAPELNTLAATCRLANSLQTTADWSIPPTKEPVLKLNSSGFGTSLGKTAAPYTNYTFDLSNRNIAGTFPVTVSGENWNFTKTVNLDVPSWNVPTISANNEYTFEIPEAGTTIPDMAPIVASPADGVNVAANCNGAVSLSAEGLPDGVAFTDGKFTGTSPESGWYQVKLKAKYANDNMNKAEKIVLLQFKRAADTTPVPKPAITLDTIVLNHKTGDTVDYALPVGYSNLSGVLPPGISVVDGKLVGTLPTDQVGEYDFSVKVDGNIQPYKFYSRDGIAPVITSGQPFLSAGSDGTTIKVKMSLSAFDNIDGKVPLRLTGLPTGFTWDGTNLNGSFPSGKTSSSLRVYAYATDQAGNEQNGLYEIKLPLVTVENKNGENVLTTGGGRPEVVLQPSVTVETGKDVAIPLQFLPSTADSVLTTNVTGLPDGLTYDPDSQTIKGTPVDSSLGEFTVQVTATDSVGGELAEPSPRIMKLTVVDKTPPTIEGLPDVISVKTDEPFSFTGTATDGSGTVTWESEGFGENISFNNGVVSSTGISTPQSALVTVKAIDGSGNTTTKQIVVNILERPAYSLPDLTVDTRPFQKVLIPADSGAEIVSCDFAAIPGSPKPTVQKSDTGDWVMSGQVFTLGAYNVTCGVKNVATGSVVDDSFVLTVQQGAAPDPEPGTPGQDTQNLPPVIAGYLDTSTAVGWKVDIAGKITSPDGTTPTVAVSSEDGEVTYDPVAQTVSFKGDTAGEATIKISAVGENGKVTTKTVKVTVVDAGNGSGTIVVPTPTRVLTRLQNPVLLVARLTLELRQHLTQVHLVDKLRRLAKSQLNIRFW